MIPWLIGAAGLGFFGFLILCVASERFTAWVLGREQDEGQPEKGKAFSVVSGGGNSRKGHEKAGRLLHKSPRNAD